MLKPTPFFQVLEFEQLYLADLPDSHNYEKSYMHRDVVTFTAVKFWYVKISHYNVQL